MTLVRVYCGLASADGSALAPEAQSWLTVSIVDDAGRLLDICEITDDPGGYSELCSLFAQRGDGPSTVAVATTSNDHAVTQLLTAAGRYIAYAGSGTADDFADRFADDGSPDEIRSGPAERRAVGLARALQAGVLSAVPQATPEEMTSIKPLLTAHAAIVSGRQQAAGTLREVLRELYPAALRAYADPAEPVSLAVLQALPEPGQLVSGAAGRSRESQVIATLVDAGVAEKEILDEAVTALRVAVAETPRRAGVTRAMTSAVAETVRQAVASVRCFDSASEALVGVIADRMVLPVRRVEVPEPVQNLDQVNGRSAPPLRVLPGALGAPTGGHSALTAPSGAYTPLTAPSGGYSALTASTGGHGALTASTGGHAALSGSTGGHAALGVGQATPGGYGLVKPAGSQPAARAGSEPPAASLPPAGMVAVPAPPLTVRPEGEPAPSTSDLPSRIAPGGRTAIPPTTRQSRPAYGSDPTSTFAGRATLGSDPTSTFAGRATLGSDPTSTFAGRATLGSDPTSTFAGRATLGTDPDATSVGLPAYGSDPTTTFAGQPAAPADQRSNGQPPPSTFAGSAPVPYQGFQAQPPAPESRNSRTNWPLVRDPAESGSYPLISGNGAADIPQAAGPPRASELRIPEQARPVEPAAADSLGIELPRQREGRVRPPWQDDLPVEPPTLRLVEPAPLADPALSSNRDDLNDLRFDPPTLRLVPSEPADVGGLGLGGDLPQVDGSADDSDLLIFAACQSAWFTDGTDSEEQLEWATAADLGWEAASQAARPAVGAETVAGLPRRVPQQNLVPGSAQPVEVEEIERPLRIVRDAAAIAAHTSGYFSGYRRGQEVGGYPVGGRPGRESSVGWDFSRDDSGDEEYTPLSVSDYEYRSARR